MMLPLLLPMIMMNTAILEFDDNASDHDKRGEERMILNLVLPCRRAQPLLLLQFTVRTDVHSRRQDVEQRVNGVLL